MDNQFSLLQTAYDCTIGFISLEPEILQNFYTYVLELLKIKEDKLLYRMLINYFSYISTTFLKKEKYVLASESYKHTENKIKISGQGDDVKVMLLAILDVFDWLNPQSELTKFPKQALEALETLYKDQNSETQYNLATASFLALRIHVAGFQLKEHSQKLRCLLKTEQEKYFKFIKELVSLMETPQACNCKENCSVKQNLLEMDKFILLVPAFAKLTIEYHGCIAIGDNIYFEAVLEHLEHCIRDIEKMKYSNCSHWNQIWQHAGVFLFNFALAFFKAKSNELCLKYSKMFVKFYLKFDRNGKEISKKQLSDALMFISDIQKSKDIELALALITLTIFLTGSNQKDGTKWVCLKEANKNIPDLQEVTMVSALQKYKKYTDCYIKIDLTKQMQEQLLIFELETYKVYWQSKVPMMAALRHLSKIGDPKNVAKTFISIWGECNLQYNPKVPTILLNITSAIEGLKNKTPQILIDLAYLLFIQHKFDLNQALTKNSQDIDKTFKLLDKENKPPEEIAGKDPDFLTVHENLSIEKYTKFLVKINKASTLIEANYKKLDVDKEKLFQLLKLMGHEYMLHDQSIRSLQSWQLALGVAKMLKNDLFKLQAITFIIPLIDVQKDRKLVEEAEALLETIRSPKTLQDIFQYYFAKSRAFFLCDFRVAYDSFLALEPLIEEIERCGGEGQKNKQELLLLNAQYHFLHHKFITLPCSFKVVGHQKFSVVRIHEAQKEILAYYTHGGEWFIIIVKSLLGTSKTIFCSFQV